MKSNFNKFPVIEIQNHNCISGWENIAEEIETWEPECYSGVYAEEINVS